MGNLGLVEIGGRVAWPWVCAPFFGITLLIDTLKLLVNHVCAPFLYHGNLSAQRAFIVQRSNRYLTGRETGGEPGQRDVGKLF